MSKQASDENSSKSQRHILVAVDESENSTRTVSYLAEFFAEDRNVFITLLSIIPEPSEDYFATADERAVWLDERRQFMENALSVYRDVFLDSGFKEGQIQTRLSVRWCNSIADAILEERERLQSDVIVVGRRGITHNEEFIFGSTSSRILHHAKNCAVMVIE